MSSTCPGNNTEVLSVSPKTTEQCTPSDCEQLLHAKQQFQIFINPNSTQLPSNNNNNISSSTQQETMMVSKPPIATVVDCCDENMNHHHQQQQEHPSQLEFTQGTTDLPSNLILQIPDQEYLQENMEYIQELLYIAPTLTLQEMILCVAYLLQNGRYAADLKLVESVMQRYDADSGDYEPFVYVDGSLQYTRNLVATDNQHWTLLLLCWNGNSASPVHNHPQCDCLVRVLKNSLMEYRYNHPDQTNNSNIVQQQQQQQQQAGCNTPMNKITLNDDSQLHCFSQAECRQGMVTLMNDDLGLHKLENHSNEIAYTLHLYFPPYNSCKIYLNQSKVATISNICYHSLRGKRNFFNGVFSQTGTDFDDNLTDISQISGKQ